MERICKNCLNCTEQYMELVCEESGDIVQEDDTCTEFVADE